MINDPLQALIAATLADAQNPNTGDGPIVPDPYTDTAGVMDPSSLPPAPSVELPSFDGMPPAPPAGPSMMGGTDMPMFASNLPTLEDAGGDPVLQDIYQQIHQASTARMVGGSRPSDLPPGSIDAEMDALAAAGRLPGEGGAAPTHVGGPLKRSFMLIDDAYPSQR